MVLINNTSEPPTAQQVLAEARLSRASYHLELPLPKVTTKELSLYARQDDIISFIKEHRRINPGMSIEEAKTDFAHFRAVLERLR